MSNQIYQKDVVDQFCPACNRIVPCDRTVYADAVYFTCRPKKHSFKYGLEKGGKVPGVKNPEPPRGYGVDD